jgi:hypothetical protein
VKEIKWGKDNGAVGVFRGIEGQRTLDNLLSDLPGGERTADPIHTGAGCCF